MPGHTFATQFSGLQTGSPTFAPGFTATNPNLQVVCVTWDTPILHTVNSISDSAGNTWNLAATIFLSLTHGAAIFWCRTTAGGPGTITINMSGSGGALVSAWWGEFQGVGVAPVLDAHNTGGNSAGSITADAGALTTSVDGELYIGVMENIRTATVTSESGWAEYTNLASVGTSKIGIAVESLGDGTNQVHGTYHATWTQGASQVWVAASASWKKS